MKPLTAILACLLILPPLGLALAQEGGEAEHEETPLEEQMHLIEETVGKLRRALRDESKVAEALAAVGAMQAATVQAKGYEPAQAAKLPAEERAAFVADYRRTLIGMLQDELALETALLDGDFEAAKEIFKKIRDLEESGHERFTEDG